ncbi:hypothetical protein AUP68_01525 [Ilyonectria robusta]
MAPHLDARARHGCCRRNWPKGSIQREAGRLTISFLSLPPRGRHNMGCGPADSFVRSRNEGSGRWLKTNRRLPIMGMESSRRRSLGVCVSLRKKDDEDGTRSVGFKRQNDVDDGDEAAQNNVDLTMGVGTRARESDM